MKNNFAMVENSDYEAEWIKFLLESKYRFHEFSPRLTSDLDQLVSRLCQKLSLSNEIEFTCLVNIHAFFHVHLQQLECLTSELQRHSGKQELCEQALDGVESQAVLHIMNVIHICAKYIENVIPIPIRSFLKLLADCYRPCELNFFKQMEFQVFQLVEFHIEPPIAYYTAVYYMRICLHEMQLNDTKFYVTLRDLLRVSFVLRNEIYKRIDTNIISNVCKYQSDQALLGLSNVLTTFILHKYPTQMIKELLKRLSLATAIPENHIIYLTTRIASVVPKMKSPLETDTGVNYDKSKHI